MDSHNPATIIDLRLRHNALCDRFHLIGKAVDSLMDLKVSFTDVLAKAAGVGHHNSFSHHENYDSDDDPTHFYDLVGSTVPVFEYNFLMAVIQEDVHCRNLVHHLKQIRYNAATSIKAVELVVGEPSFVGWNESEIDDAIVYWYRNRISRATTEIRDINTNWKCLMKEKSILPGFVRSSCTGLFGGPSFKTKFTYTNDDFTHNFKINGKFPVMSARWFAPFLGDDMADAIEKAVAVIGDASKPLPGEPDTLSGF